MDDLCTGGSRINEVQNIKTQLFEYLLQAGFELRKFNPNKPEVISDLPDLADNKFQFGDSKNNLKILGRYWEPQNDCLKFSINIQHFNKITQLFILSYISQIFDPLGLLAPVVFVSKRLIQRLWQVKLDWDESVSLDIMTMWNAFYASLESLNTISIKRPVIVQNTTKFSDASESGYGACIYIRPVNPDGNIQVNLLCAKTRVAPIKTITIPRLELCGALLLAELFDKVIKSLQISFDNVYFWSDFTLVISWINSSSQQFKIFVANRISQINALTSAEKWHYISTQENPADLLSRGLNANDILQNTLWWNGPAWLSLPSQSWPATNPPSLKTNLPEQRIIKSTLKVSILEVDWFERFSKFSKLQRVIAYVLRYVHNSRKPKAFKEVGFLKSSELKTEHKTITDKSKIISLHPFIDTQGVLRVGGSLYHSLFDNEKKHPAILPAKHKLTYLIIQYEHVRLLHAGPQLLLSSLRDTF